MVLIGTDPRPIGHEPSAKHYIELPTPFNLYACISIGSVVLLQRECRSEITYSPPNPNPNFFVLDERADPGQN